MTAQISFSNQNSLLEKKHVHSGVAIGVLDMNGDGLDDILRLDNGTELRIEYQTSPDQPFLTKIIGEITSDPVWGICAADINNDGFPDVLMGGSYDGIKIVTSKNGGMDYAVKNIVDPQTFVQGVNFADIDNDGWLDAFVCHDDGTSRTFQNDGTGNMVYDPTMINLATEPASDNSGNYGSVWTDFDNDGDLDLYIAKCRQGVNSDTDPRRINQLFVNNGNGTFTQDITNEYGLRIGAQSWTADFGDIDNDGDMDCFITNHDVSSQLLENDGTGHFTDISFSAGIEDEIEGLPVQGVFRDFDNDGFMDILVSGSDHYLFHNNGDKTFSILNDVFDQNEIESYAIGDLNSDGFLDIYAGYGYVFSEPSLIDDVLWMNDGNDNHYFGINLRGTLSNKSGVGARITVHTAAGIQIREIRAGESYGITNALQGVFGLGQTDQIDSVLVRWPSGTIDVIKNPAIDAYLTLEEGGCVVPQISIAAAGSTTICTGDSLLLTAPAGYSYLWSNGDTTDKIQVKTAGNYQVAVLSPNGCKATSNIIVVSSDPIEIPTIKIFGDTVLCPGAAVTLTAPNSSSYTWNNGAVTQSITVSEQGNYWVQTQGLCAKFTSNPLGVRTLIPALPVPTADVTWFGGEAVLTATGDELHWYDAQTGGIELFVGPVFVTPQLFQDYTFWVANNEIEDQPNQFTGMTDHEGNASNSNQFNGQIIFDCLTPFRLAKAKVYATIEKERKIDLLDVNGTILQSKIITIPVGTSVVTLDFDIPAGNGLVLTTDPAYNLDHLGTISPQLRRSDSGVNYPYVIPNVVSINTSNAPSDPSSRYYYFYDWEIDFYGHECLSERVPVQSTVDPNLVNATDLLDVQQLRISPNPTDGMVVVTCQNWSNAAATLRILDQHGKVLLEKEVMDSKAGIPMNISVLPTGMYILECSDGQKRFYQKLVKQ